MLHSLKVPVWLHYENDLNAKIMVYALLDDQSDVCFVKQATIETLGVSGQETPLKLSTVLAEETITSQRIFRSCGSWCEGTNRYPTSSNLYEKYHPSKA